MVEKYDYNRSIATANRMISRFGMQGTVRHFAISGPEYAPVRVAQDYPVTLVLMNFQDYPGAQNLVQQGDRTAYVSIEGLPITITIRDQIIVSGIVYEVVNARPLNPAGTLVYYNLHVRK